MSKAKISDVRQGVTLHYVHAFPHKGMPSYIESIFVTKRPFKHSIGLFSECKVFYNDDLGQGSYLRQWSLRDAGIIENKYNFHRTFTSLKAAKRYAASMDRNCLNAQEQAKLKEKLLTDRMFNDF